MTTIITRLYPDPAAAQTVVQALRADTNGRSSVQVITRDGDGPLADRMNAARITPAAARAYADGVERGGALLVVEAPFAPLGTALQAIAVVNAFPSLDVGLDDQDAYIREEPILPLEGRVLSGRRFYMTNPHSRLPMGHILGSDPIRRGGVRNSAIRGGKHMSRAFWPMKLVSTNRTATSAIKGGFLFSSLFGLRTTLATWGPRDDFPTTL